MYKINGEEMKSVMSLEEIKQIFEGELLPLSDRMSNAMWRMLTDEIKKRDLLIGEIGESFTDASVALGRIGCAIDGHREVAGKLADYCLSLLESRNRAALEDQPVSIEIVVDRRKSRQL